MSAPYFESFSLPVYLTLAALIGFFFGFFLERAGFSSAKKLTDQFYFRDWAVFKVMFTAIITAMMGMAYLSLAGWLDMSEVFIPPTYLWPQLVGGLMVGAGFIVGGYCPGTSVAAAAIGKLDAVVFLVGIVIGSFLFGEGFGLFEEFSMSGSLGTLTLPVWLDINTGVVVLGVVLIALGGFWAAENSEGRWNLFGKTYGRGAGVKSHEG